ncbi:MAG: proprotein convertase P-domain-containing protein [Solirubrobacterales bacterium]
MIKKRSARLALLACASVGSVGLIAGASPASAATATKTFTQCFSTAAPILDFQTASAALNVSVPKNGKKIQDGTVTNVTAGVRFTHTDDNDVSVILASPGGRGISLEAGRGGVGDGFGTGANSCSGSLVQFSDGFTTPISTPGNTGENPVTGSFKPDQPLATFNGSAARGNWTLLAHDQAGADEGVLGAFSLSVTYTYKKAKKKKK